MSIRDEAVEAGLKCYAEGGCMGLAEYERREVVVDILEAARPHLSQGAVRVKPLEWGKTSYGSPEAHSIARTYRINEDTSGGWAVAAGHEVLSDTDGRRNFASIDDAKAAAQADYERRILSALSPAPVGVMDGVNNAARDLLASIDPERLNPEQFNAWSALAAALASHEPAPSTPAPQNRR